MSTATQMAKERKKKPGPKPQPPSEQREDLIAVRCRSVYKEWLQRFAEMERSTPTNLIDKALADLAQSRGFEPPPRR
jgi:hypothetical protein